MLTLFLGSKYLIGTYYCLWGIFCNLNLNHWRWPLFVPVILKLWISGVVDLVHCLVSTFECSAYYKRKICQTFLNCKFHVTIAIRPNLQLMTVKITLFNYFYNLSLFYSFPKILPEDVIGIWSGDGTASVKGCILSGLRNFCLLILIKFSGSPNSTAFSFHNCLYDKYE